MDKEDTEIFRKTITDGDLQTFFDNHHQYYSISGIIVQGNQMGRKIGFPTANIEILNSNIVPKEGVYAVYVLLEHEIFYGMLNIGTRPTFNLNTQTIEVHILDYSKNIYNIEISVFFVERIRDEEKFRSKELLVEQLEKDKVKIKSILQKALPPIL